MISASSLMAQQQAPPRFAGGTDAILVDVSVTRAGARVGMTEDFIIKDSGCADHADRLHRQLPYQPADGV
jgi:hypothetical protein